MRVVRIVGFALTGWFFLAPLAQADTVAATMAKWGLTGTWAKDCSRPPGNFENTYLTYVVDGDHVTLHRRFGEHGYDDGPILSAVIRDDGAIDIQIGSNNEPDVYEEVLILDKDGHERAIATHNVGTGMYTVKDGTMVSTGQPTVWLTRCSS